ncbi:PIN domain-like protein [Xylariaceae sp. FL1019]|nr:PIN domain-like protein [Xylariaceae sp. FL1019]
MALIPKPILTGDEEFSLPETGAGRLQSLQRSSLEHFARTGKPLRIAIDEKSWWLRELSANVEAAIKEEFPNSEVRETVIMKRILFLLRLNIQVIFVSDGRYKPVKPSYDEVSVNLLRRLLYHMGVPQHKAPGESAAECARLQRQRIVDAVWTTDWKALLFGATTIIDFSQPEERDYLASENLNTVIMYKVDDMKMSLVDLFMHALIVGCDYSIGLAGCGRVELAQMRKAGLFPCLERDLEKKLTGETDKPVREWASSWRALLEQIVHATWPDGPSMELGYQFPLEEFRACAYPTVSSHYELLDLPCLRQGWIRRQEPSMLVRGDFFSRNFRPKDGSTNAFLAWLAEEERKKKNLKRALDESDDADEPLPKRANLEQSEPLSRIEGGQTGDGQDTEAAITRDRDGESVGDEETGVGAESINLGQPQFTFTVAFRTKEQSSEAETADGTGDGNETPNLEQPQFTTTIAIHPKRD